MNNKQKLVYLSLIALTIIGILSGASYAYFSVENKICNSTLISTNKDIEIFDYLGTASYYKVIFSNGTTIPGNKIDNPITETNAVCSW